MVEKVDAQRKLFARQVAKAFTISVVFTTGQHFLGNFGRLKDNPSNERPLAAAVSKWDNVSRPGWRTGTPLPIGYVSGNGRPGSRWWNCWLSSQLRAFWWPTAASDSSGAKRLDGHNANNLKQIGLNFEFGILYKTFPKGGAAPWLDIKDYSAAENHSPGKQGLLGLSDLALLEEGALQNLATTALQSNSVPLYFCPRGARRPEILSELSG
jgi:hypothetical protein